VDAAAAHPARPAVRLAQHLGTGRLGALVVGIDISDDE
jgi:hypothetical protein